MFEYEAAESTVSSAGFVEHGIPPRAYHRIRYTGIYAGPLHAYVKTIPYLFTLDPGGEVVFLNLLNAGAALLLFFLLRRLFGLLPATVTLFLLAFSEPSIQRCTSIHVRCYSVPLVLIAMVLAARVLLLREHWLLPLFAVAFAFATQVYGFATMFLPPGLLLLFLLFRPQIPRRTFDVSVALFAILQIPWILEDVVRGIDGPVSVFREGLFVFPAQDVQDVDQARAGALGFIGLVTRVVLFDNATMIRLGLVGLAAMIAGAAWRFARRRPLHENSDVFFLLWLAMFLLVPAYLGAGERQYLAQFLGPFVLARGLTLPFEWLGTRPWRSVRIAAGAAIALIAGAGIVLAYDNLSGPRPTRVLSDPTYAQSLPEIRAVVRHVHDRGLGRIGFNERVHGAVLQKDVFADSYLFWTMCHDDARVPCSAGADALPPRTHFAALGLDFPFRPAEGALSRYGTLTLVEYDTRLRFPFQAIAYPSAQPATPHRQDDRFAGPPRALRPPPPGTTASDAADRLAQSESWPADDPGAPVGSIRRSSQVAAVMVDHRLDEKSFRPEARFPGPFPLPVELVMRGTLEIDRLPEPGTALHLFLTASYDEGRCQASILLDGVPLPQTRLDDPRGEWGQFLLKLDADTTGRLQPGRHTVTVRLHECSAELYDFYDLVVATK